MLRRATARAADDIGVDLLVARARPLLPAVRPARRPAPVGGVPKAAAVAKLGGLAAAKVALPTEALVQDPLGAAARRAALAVGEADVEVAALGPVVEGVDQVVRRERRPLQLRVEVGADGHVAVDDGDVEAELLDDSRHVVVARVPEPAHLVRVLAPVLRPLVPLRPRHPARVLLAEVPARVGARDHPGRPVERLAVRVRHDDHERVVDAGAAEGEDEVGDPRRPQLVPVRQDQLPPIRTRRRRPRQLSRLLEVPAAVGGHPPQRLEVGGGGAGGAAKGRPHGGGGQLRRQAVPTRRQRRVRQQGPRAVAPRTLPSRPYPARAPPPGPCAATAALDGGAVGGDGGGGGSACVHRSRRRRTRALVHGRRRRRRRPRRHLHTADCPVLAPKEALCKDLERIHGGVLLGLAQRLAQSGLRNQTHAAHTWLSAAESTRPWLKRMDVARRGAAHLEREAYFRAPPEARRGKWIVVSRLEDVECRRRGRRWPRRPRPHTRGQHGDRPVAASKALHASARVHGLGGAGGEPGEEKEESRREHRAHLNLRARELRHRARGSGSARARRGTDVGGVLYHGA